ncbi:unnamed protein product [Calicophoron daubneyi]|uniref:Mediator of RNA polymerase II transcription subunit 28 n=1 Tax=Calicophoron daubneyi TaxID=300641 RepID=A0AAV2TZS0_CALDB
MSGERDQKDDSTLWSEFENQLDNIFLVLSSSSASVDSGASEARHGINDRHMTALLDACRALDSWFIKKRFLLSAQCPDFVLREEIEDIRMETARKEKLLGEMRVKIKNYVDAIGSIVDQTTKDLSYRPQV